MAKKGCLAFFSILIYIISDLVSASRNIVSFSYKENGKQQKCGSYGECYESHGLQLQRNRKKPNQDGGTTLFVLGMLVRAFILSSVFFLYFLQIIILIREFYRALNLKTEILRLLFMVN